MSKDFGFIRPDVHGDWHWPFAHMEPGDVFHVSPADREPRRVRNLVKARGHQLGRFFSCTVDRDGTATVCYGRQKAIVDSLPLEIKYNHFAVLIFKHSHYNSDRLPWDEIVEDQLERFAPIALEGYEGNKRLMVTVARRLYGVMIQADGLSISLLHKDTTPEQWDALLALMAD